MIMKLAKVDLTFFPKYQFLLGCNIYMHETMDMKKEERYDGIDIEIGLGILILTISLLSKKKGDI